MRQGPLLQNTRGTVANEYLVGLALIGLAGVGGMSTLGLATHNAISGDVDGAEAAMRGAATTRQAAEEGEVPAGGEVPFAASDPAGVRDMSDDALKQAYGQLAEQLPQAEAIVAQYEGVDPSTLPPEEAEAVMGAFQFYEMGSLLAPEYEAEIFHRQFNAHYKAQGAQTELDVINGLEADLAASTDQLAKREEEIVKNFESRTGTSCLTADGAGLTPECEAAFNEAYTNDPELQFLASVNQAQQFDLERRMFELGLEYGCFNQATGAQIAPDQDPNCETGVFGHVQLTDENGNPIRRHYQGSWSLQGLVMGPEGFLVDKDGREMIFEPGVDPEAAIEGKVKPLGAIDPETGELVEANTGDGGLFSWLRNTPIGIGKELWDIVAGTGVALFRVGWDFIGEDLIAGTLNLLSGNRLFKGFRWSGEDNPIRAITNFGGKILPTVWSAVKSLGSNAWDCVRGSTVADARGQACGRTVTSVVALFLPFTKGGVAGKAGSAIKGVAGKVPGAAKFGAWYGESSSLLAKTLRLGAAGLQKGGEGFAAAADKLRTLRIRRLTTQRDKLVADAQRLMGEGKAAAADNLFAQAKLLDDAIANGGRGAPAASVGTVPRPQGVRAQGSLLERYRNHKLWKAEVVRQIGHGPVMWREVFNRTFARGQGQSVGGYAINTPGRFFKGVLRYPVDKWNFLKQKSAVMGGRAPARFRRWYWENRDFTGPGSALAGGYADGVSLYEDLARQVYEASQDPAAGGY